MKTYYWFDPNRFVSHQQTVTAGRIPLRTNNASVKNSIKRSRVRLGLILLPILFGCFAVFPPTRAAGADLGNVLGGHQWLVRSFTLGNGTNLGAVFNPDGTFTGMFNAPPGGLFLRTQRVNGAWYVTGRLLFLQWDWIEGTGPYASQRHNEIPIEIRSSSARRLTGVDKWWRLWTFERIES
jgi:hypothetical protein